MVASVCTCMCTHRNVSCTRVGKRALYACNHVDASTDVDVPVHWDVVWCSVIVPLSRDIAVQKQMPSQGASSDSDVVPALPVVCRTPWRHCFCARHAKHQHVSYPSPVILSCMCVMHLQKSKANRARVCVLLSPNVPHSTRDAALTT